MSKELDKLIEQMLLEKGFDYTQPDHATPDAIFKVLAAIEPPDDHLTDADLDILITEPEKIDTDVERKLIALKMDPKVIDTDLKIKAQAALDAKKAALPKEPGSQTLSDPQIHPQAAASGKYAPELTTIVNRVLGSGGSIEERVKKISEISVNYFKASREPENAPALLKGDPSQSLTELMLLDVLNFIVKEMDSGSGAYLFEYFLALVCGGTVTGRGMGAVDFTSSDTSNGSAKYYSKGQGLSQALSVFPEGKTTYVIAIKKQGAEQFGAKTRGAADPNRIIALELYFADVVKKDEEFTINGEKASLIDAGTDHPALNLNPVVNGTGTILRLAQVYTQTFRQMIDAAIENTTSQEMGKLRNAYFLMKTLYDQLATARSQSKIYVAEEDREKRLQAGNATLLELDKSKDSFTQLVGSLEHRDTYDPSADKITESQSLDEMIIRIAKEILK